MLDGITTSFVDKAEELRLNLSDALDRCAKKRWDFGVLTYWSLCKMVSHGRIPSTVTSITFMASPRAQDSKIPDSTEDPYSTQWLSALLSDLAPIKNSDRRVAHLLEKLSRFTQGHRLRLHPHNFLRILNSLQLWELCCPDLSVAIEVQDSVTKHFYNGFRLHNIFLSATIVTVSEKNNHAMSEITPYTIWLYLKGQKP
ncbi:coiled-coil domain-containing protein 60-like [Megalobrama amblycephala]|uniref:coiled-coil domain-containing protein 60-like n=1 Tax=Megalobrama amblycephala TaxID=75352 RepID=UPI002013CC2B|nr:coiled-coil domain-containing protein 60-like [Megalobrama amblycephala]